MDTRGASSDAAQLLSTELASIPTVALLLEAPGEPCADSMLELLLWAWRVPEWLGRLCADARVGLEGTLGVGLGCSELDSDDERCCCRGSEAAAQLLRDKRWPVPREPAECGAPPVSHDPRSERRLPLIVDAASLPPCARHAPPPLPSTPPVPSPASMPEGVESLRPPMRSPLADDRRETLAPPGSN
eukprot:363330-Chlamydomonas_euryale.AAC.2